MQPVCRSALLFALLLMGIASRALGQRYAFESYGQRQGLDNLSVVAAAFDAAGFLWVGTENGLYRLRGERFERFGEEQGLKERGMIDVYVDSWGRIWVATKGDLYRWTGRDFEPLDSKPTAIWSARRIVSPDAHHLLAIRERQLIEFTLDDSGRMLSSRPVFSDQLRQTMPSQGDITTVEVSRDGTIWVGCGYQVCSWKEGLLKVWGAAGGVPSLTPHQEYWQEIRENRDGSIWVSSSRHTLQLSLRAARFVDHGIPASATPGNVSTSPILFDRMGRTLRSAGQGLARWDGIRWQPIGAANGLPGGGPIASVTLDRNGDVWLGTESSGVHHWLGYENWEAWTTAEGLPDDSVWSLLQQDESHLLIGTEKGPAQLDLASGRIAPFYSGPVWKDGQVSGLDQDSHGQIWATTWTGKLVRIDAATRRPAVAGSPSWFLYGELRLPDHRLLLLGRDGIYAQDDPARGGVAHPEQAAQALLDGKRAVYSACTLPNGEVWVYANEALLRLRNGEWSQPRLAGLDLQGFGPLSLDCSRDGSLWLGGTDRAQEPAIWHIPSGSRGGAATVNRLALPQFMSRLLVHSVMTDRRGWLWVASDVGVAVWSGRQWQHFSQESGLIWNDTNQTGMLEAADGTIWIATSGGVAHMMHPEKAFDRSGLPVTITGVQRGELRFLPGESIVLPWSGAPVRFAYASPTGWDRSVTQFKYRISGLNSAWIQTADNEAAFSSLPPGKYQFEVMAVNPESGAASPVAAAAFQILAPWWLRWWFVGLIFVSGGVGLWVAVRSRTRALVWQQRRLEALVRERTRELEASREVLRIQATHDTLTGLYNRGAIMKRLDEEIERASREGTLLAVLLVDIDHFKRVNDTLGHMAGDATLRIFAKALKESIRRYDEVGRYGGEEFLLLLGNLAGDMVEQRLAEIHAGLSNLSFDYEGREIRVNCSIGVSYLEPRNAHGCHKDANLLLCAADSALYEAKRAGRNCVVQQGRSGKDEMTMVPVHR